VLKDPSRAHAGRIGSLCGDLHICALHGHPWGNVDQIGALRPPECQDTILAMRFRAYFPASFQRVSEPTLAKRAKSLIDPKPRALAIMNTRPTQILSPTQGVAARLTAGAATYTALGTRR